MGRAGRWGERLFMSQRANAFRPAWGSPAGNGKIIPRQTYLFTNAGPPGASPKKCLVGGLRLSRTLEGHNIATSRASCKSDFFFSISSRHSLQSVEFTETPRPRPLHNRKRQESRSRGAGGRGWVEPCDANTSPQFPSAALRVSFGDCDDGEKSHGTGRCRRPSPPPRYREDAGLGVFGLASIPRPGACLTQCRPLLSLVSHAGPVTVTSSGYGPRED